MDFISSIKTTCGLWLVAVFSSHTAMATMIPIDLNAFIPSEPEIIISLDGMTATINESPLIAIVTLENDPGLGDAEVILAAPSRLLTFGYDFNEPPGNDDVFSAVLFDSAVGPLDGVLDGVDINATQAGTVAFDLSPWEGFILGLSFVLSDADPQGLQNSSVTITQLQMSDDHAVVPVPSTMLLLFSGIVVLASWRRKQNSLPF